MDEIIEVVVRALTLEDGCPLNYLEQKSQHGDPTDGIEIRISKEQTENLIKKVKDNPKYATVLESSNVIGIVWNTEKCGREKILLRKEGDWYALVIQETNTNAKVEYIERESTKEPINQPVKQRVYIR